MHATKKQQLREVGCVHRQLNTFDKFAHLVRVVKLIIHEPGDNACLPYALVTKEDLCAHHQRTPVP